MRRRLFAALVVLAWPATAAADWQARDVAGVQVQVYVPASTSPIGDGHGLLVALHGCTQTATQLRELGNFELAAEELGAVIALPDVPGGGVLAGCWDYYGAMHSRDAGHGGSVVAMTEALRDDASLGIDPAQIYVAGFSSGGGEALVLGCVAPDLFAGVAVGAGPSLGTSSSEIASVATTADAAASVCESLAGGRAGELSTQLAITFTDTADYVVAQQYAEVNADMFDLVYADGTLETSPADVAAMEGSNPTGDGTYRADAEGPRVLWLSTTSGTGHNWPAGSGATADPLAFVSGAGVNLSYVAVDFFTDHARRAAGPADPGDTSGEGGDDVPGVDDSGAGGTTTSGGAAGDGSSGTGHPAEDETGSGCQCASAPGRAPAALAFATLLLLAVRRR